MRCERPAQRQKPEPCETKPCFLFPHFLPVCSQTSVLKVPKRGKFHAAIRVTPKRCDSCAQGAPGRRTASRRNFCDAVSLVRSAMVRPATKLPPLQEAYGRVPRLQDFCDSDCGSISTAGRNQFFETPLNKERCNLKVRIPSLEIAI